MQAQYIKVNLPLTEEDYQSGNGEGVWVIVDNKTKADYYHDAYGPGFVGMLANDSFYYPGLCCGDSVEFEMRGDKRPVADYHNFLCGRTKLTKEGKAILIAAIASQGGNPK